MIDGVRRSVARALNVQEDYVLPKPDLGKYAFEVVHMESSMTNKDRPFVENGDAIPATDEAKPIEEVKPETDNPKGDREEDADGKPETT
jgi:hypothetical protein